ncbi:MAG TPA: TonB-dependent receptor [Candidatus Avacidaminococcus intestinavium]|uniref:TonB-dependent receptor n=1 Tax=Candidatus Avacidaminococcus intestinavium TaxID=2840684 RepID=A0A9D1MQF2_9FIRM|nr:TonB-dependent receptor [Candidatus Avacidaminococcus intestinavium]
MKKNKKIVTKLLMTTTLTLAAIGVEAAEVPQYSLDPMVITATKTEVSIKDNPHAVELITRDKLEAIHATTLKDALKNAIGVNIFNDFQGRSNISIRGSESRHVLILLDGKRLGGELSYNSANAWDVERIRMEDVERIEVIRGPVGALYGSDAMGGVINIITKQPEKTSGSVNYEYNWYENGNGAGYKSNLYLQGKEQKLSYKLSTGLNKNRPYRDSSGSDDDMNFFGKAQPISLGIGYEVSNEKQLNFDFSRFKENNNKGDMTYTAMGPNKLRSENVINNDNKRTDYAITYKGKGTQENWQVRAYQSVYDKRYTSSADKYLIRPNGNESFSSSTTKVDTVKRTISVIEGQESWVLNAKNYITAGFEYRRDHSEGTRLKKKGTSLPENGTAEDAYDSAAINYSAIYLQDEYRPNEKWFILPSLRYDYSNKFGSDVTASLGATYNVNETTRWKALVGQGYKTPTVNELYHFWEMYAANRGGPGQFFEGNPDLKPEKSLGYELSFEKDYAKNATLHIGIFRNQVKDLINAYWTGKNTGDYQNEYPGIINDRVMTYENVPKATLQGAEIYTTHQISPVLSLNLGYTFLDAKNKTDNRRLTDRAKHRITLGASYRPQDSYAWNYELDLVSNFNYFYNDASKGSMGNNVYSTKNFTVVNIMASKKISKDYDVYLGIDNIGNHQNFGAYADGNIGRVYRMGMDYSF